MPTAETITIFDGHNDTLLDLYLHSHSGDSSSGRSFFERSNLGHLDLPRAREGGLGGGFFALFTPNGPRQTDSGGQLIEFAEHAYAQQFTLGMAALLFQLEREAGGSAKIVRSVDELETCLLRGVFAILFHIEGAESIDVDLNLLEVLYQAGLRSLGITWSRANAFGTGVPFAFPQSPDIGPGLTAAGKNLVRVCNELGILVDVSHLNEKGFWDVEQLSTAPLVATHSCAYALSPAARNLTNKQLDAIRASNGIVGVNFHVGFLRTDGRRDSNTSLSEIARHVDYMVERMGIEHVAFGSDFDGATMPGDLRDVAGLPKLVAELRERGYDDAALRKLGHENWLRVLGATWK